jgi:hypothetical protein
MSNLNENYLVYLNGTFPSTADLNKQSDTLAILVEQFRKSGKSDAQIYSILSGMGIENSKISAYFEAEKMGVPTLSPTQPKTSIPATEFIQVISVEEKNNTNKMNITETLKKAVLESVEALKPFHSGKFSYTASKASLVLTESLATIDKIEKMMANEVVERIKSQIERISSETNENLESAVENITAKVKSEVLAESESLNSTVGSKIRNEELNLISYLSNSLQQLKDFSPVSGLFSHVKESVERNTFSLKLNYYLNSVPPSAIYNKAVNEMKGEFNKGENYLRENFTEFEKWNWVPGISQMVKEFSDYTKSLRSNGSGKLVKVYSPIQENADKSITFFINGKFYAINEGKIEAVNENQYPTTRTLAVLEGLSLMKDMGNTFSYFKGNKSFDINKETGSITINGKAVTESEAPKIINILRENAVISLNDSSVVDKLAILIESIDSIKELDFVHSINSIVHKGVTVNMIRINENVYINRINSAMNVNEMVEVSNPKIAQELVNEFVNFDISHLVYDLLEKNEQEILELNKKFEEINTNLKFLQEKKSDIERVMYLKPDAVELKEAIEFVSSEITSQEKNLSDMYIKLANLTEKKS